MNRSGEARVDGYPVTATPPQAGAWSQHEPGSILGSCLPYLETGRRAILRSVPRETESRISGGQGVAWLNGHCMSMHSGGKKEKAWR